MAEDFNHLRDGKEIVLITVKGQIEGFAAAWIANRILVRQAKLKVRWYALDPTKPFPITADQIRDCHVRFVGLGCGRGILEKIDMEARSIILYDNDFETKNKVGGLRWVKVDLKKSPAKLFWNELRTTMQITVEQIVAPVKPTDKPKKVANTVYFDQAPWLVDYVEKKEFWPWKGINPVLVAAGIRSFKEDFDKWDDLACRDISDVARIGGETFKAVKTEKENQKRNGAGKDNEQTKDKPAGRSKPAKPGQTQKRAAGPVGKS